MEWLAWCVSGSGLVDHCHVDLKWRWSWTGTGGAQRWLWSDSAQIVLGGVLGRKFNSLVDMLCEWTWTFSEPRNGGEAADQGLGLGWDYPGVLATSDALLRGSGFFKLDESFQLSRSSQSVRLADRWVRKKQRKVQKRGKSIQINISNRKVGKRGRWIRLTLIHLQRLQSR